MATEEIFIFLDKSNYQNQLKYSFQNIQLMQKYLNKIRKLAGFTSEQLGKVLGISGQTILNLEKNKITIKESTVKKLYDVFLQSALKNIEHKNFLLFNILIALFYYNSPDQYGTNIIMKSPKNQDFIETNIFNDFDLLEKTIIFQLDKYNDKLSFPPEATCLINNLESFTEIMNSEFSAEWLLLSGDSMINALSSNLRNLRIIANLSTDYIRQQFNLEKSSYAHYELGTCTLNISQANLFLEALLSENHGNKELLKETLGLIFLKNYKNFKTEIDSSINEIVQIIQSNINVEILNYTLIKMLRLNKHKVFFNQHPFSLNEVLKMPYIERNCYLSILKESCIEIKGMDSYCIKKQLFDNETIYAINPKISVSSFNNYIKIDMGINTIFVEESSLESFIVQLLNIQESMINNIKQKTTILIKDGELHLNIIEPGDYQELRLVSSFVKIGSPHNVLVLNYPSNIYNLTKLINELINYKNQLK